MDKLTRPITECEAVDFLNGLRKGVLTELSYQMRKEENISFMKLLLFYTISEN